MSSARKRLRLHCDRANYDPGAGVGKGRLLAERFYGPGVLQRCSLSFRNRSVSLRLCLRVCKSRSALQSASASESATATDASDQVSTVAAAADEVDREDGYIVDGGAHGGDPTDVYLSPAASAAGDGTAGSSTDADGSGADAAATISSPRSS